VKVKGFRYLVAITQALVGNYTKNPSRPFTLHSDFKEPVAIVPVPPLEAEQDRGTVT